jgi:DNA (cytosine-5)-methyltransferase 1
MNTSSTPTNHIDQDDGDFLRQANRPAYEENGKAIGLVDLFAGCGGMSLGVAEAALREGRGLKGLLAVDFDPVATGVYQHNFPYTQVETRGVEEIFDGELGKDPTDVERGWQAQLDVPVDILIGGPPCQGHSDLNNHSRRDDHRNALYLRMGRAAEILRPSVIMIENVPAVQHAKQGVVAEVESHLESKGYQVASLVLDVSRLGVPQKRKRHVLLAIAEAIAVNPAQLLSEVGHPPTFRDVKWAIGDLEHIVPDAEFDQRSKASKVNQDRMNWFFEDADNRYDLPDELRPPCHKDKSHSYKSMYGRLYWDIPAQTITTGFTSMGQGRYVHPSHPRTITPHEAARLQGFPDFFDFTVEGKAQRTAWSKLIGNAVPPQLSTAVLQPIIRAMTLGPAQQDAPITPFQLEAPV